MNKTPLKPLGSFIYFKLLPNEGKKSNIILPGDSYKRDLRKGLLCLGQVISIGSKVKELKLKDYFFFHEYSVENHPTMKVNDCYFIKESEILCITNKIPTYFTRSDKIEETFNKLAEDKLQSGDREL